MSETQKTMRQFLPISQVFSEVRAGQKEILLEKGNGYEFSEP